LLLVVSELILELRQDALLCDDGFLLACHKRLQFAMPFG